MQIETLGPALTSEDDRVRPRAVMLFAEVSTIAAFDISGEAQLLQRQGPQASSTLPVTNRRSQWRQTFYILRQMCRPLRSSFQQSWQTGAVLLLRTCTLAYEL